MKGKTLRKFILSHVIVQLIVLSTIIPLILFVLHSEKEQQADVIYSQLNAGVSALSAEIESAGKLVSMMHEYSAVDQIIRNNGPIVKNDYYHAAEARKLWYVSTQNWNLLKQHYVFFQNNEIIFTPERIFFDWEGFYGYWFSIRDLSVSEWSQNTRQSIRQARKTFIPAQQIDQFDIGTKDVIMYTIPFADPFNSGMVFCMIDANQLCDMLFSELPPGSASLSLYDSGGNLLYSSSAPDTVLYSSQPVSSVKVGGEPLRVFSLHDHSSGLTYVVSMPETAISAEYDSGSWRLLAYSIAVLLLSSYLSIYFAYRQYSPIKELYQSFRQMSGTPHHPGQKDEYQYFQESFTDLIRNNQEIRKTLAGYDAALTTRAFEDLLRGRYANEQELAKLIGYVTLPARWRTCLAILEMNGENDESAAYSLFSVELTSAVCKSWKEDVLVHPLRENRVLFIIPVGETDEPDQISERLNGALHAILRETGVEVRFALSGVYESAGHLPAAYEESKSIMACRHSLEGYIYFPEDVDSVDAPPVITAVAAARLHEYVQAGESDKTGEIICSYLKNRYLRERDYSQLYFSVRGILMQLTASVPEVESEVSLPYYQPDRPRDEQTEAMLTAARELCLCFANRRRGRSDQLKNRLLAYLQENYADPEIYGKSVAAQFGLNEKYLYTFFKEQTGESFAAYLERLRLNQAVELLKNSRFSVNEISQMIGFNSPNTFYKAFRRVYGSSPSVYRNMTKE